MIASLYQRGSDCIVRLSIECHPEERSVSGATRDLHFIARGAGAHANAGATSNEVNLHAHACKSLASLGMTIRESAPLERHVQSAPTSDRGERSCACRARYIAPR